MTVLTITITNSTFDKKSSEVAYMRRVLENVAATLERTRGASSAPTNVLGTNSAGTPNSVVASYTYTASASNP